MSESSATGALAGASAAPAEEDPSDSVWRFARATRAHVIIDAGPYFAVMQEAMLATRQRLMLIGWDFDTRMKLGQGRRWWNLPRRAVFPARLGAFVIWLANRTEGLEVRVLKWNFGALKFVFRGSMILDLARWWRHPSIDFKFDSAHPLGCSHHQKIVVIDDRVAVCGGIDMTSARWDTPQHLDHDPRRRQINGKPYGPWHDATMLIEGDAAAALGALGRERWVQAGGAPMEPCAPQEETAWPKSLEAEFRDVEVGIARTRSAWKGITEVREIEALFVEHILRAKTLIYAESQYFASRKVAEAIAERLEQPNPPEIVIINPLSAEGWLEQTAMDGARVQLLHAIGAHDPANKFRIFIPFTTGGEAIYVHSKLMIVDDEIIRVGSANFNNRSMGLDSEFDAFIDAARAGSESAGRAITALRHKLLAEHTGQTPEIVADLLAQHKSMAGMLDALPKGGKCLRRLEMRELTDTELAIADAEALDPERPEEMLPFYKKRGLFRSRILRRPRNFRLGRKR